MNTETADQTSYLRQRPADPEAAEPQHRLLLAESPLQHTHTIIAASCECDCFERFKDIPVWPNKWSADDIALSFSQIKDEWDNNVFTIT